MSWFILCMALTGISFESQEIPGLRIGPVQALSGVAQANFRQIDLNGDKRLDLLFPDWIYVQDPQGHFSKMPTPFSNGAPPCSIDCWENLVYCRDQAGLRVYAFQEESWQTQLEQSLQWPHKPQGHTGSFLIAGEKQSARLEPFLYDNDADGVPEIVCIHADGVEIYKKQGSAYALDQSLTPFPPLQLDRSAGVTGAARIWPAHARELRFPAREMRCRIVLENQTVRVFTEAERTQMQLIHTIRSLPLTRARDEAAPDSLPWSSKAMPAFLRPCRLNEDECMDFAGCRWLVSQASPAMPSLYPKGALSNRLSASSIPIYETWATLDGGESFQIRRAKAFHRSRPHCSFIDFDGDGDKDMLTEAASFYNHGIREAIVQLFTRKALDHEIQVYAQVQGVFSREPLLSHRLQIKLQEAPCQNGPLLRRYQAGELINMTGDFNGDGYRDLAVQNSARTISLYLAAGPSFPHKPQSTIGLRQGGRFAVSDIDGDGKSDIIVRWMDEAGHLSDTSTVYLVRETTS